MLCPIRKDYALKMLTVVLAAAIGAGTSGCGSSGVMPGPKPVPTTIAFQSSRALDGSDAANTNNTANIWVINADGSNATPLTKLTAANDSMNPVWSRDGSKVAFSSVRALDGSNAANTISNIWVMKADGTGATPLTKLTAVNALSFNPVWSPDGSKIAFLSRRALDGSDAANTNATTNIWVVNVDGSGATALTKLTAPGAGNFDRAWSPDGSKVAFASGRALDGSDAANTNGTRNIWVVNADGSGATALTKLTASAAGSFGPAWSPDGSKVAFASSRALDGSDAANTTSNIWVMKPDGSGAAPLTKLTTGSETFGPAWSPDGSKVAFESPRALDGSNAAGNNFNAWVINADGSAATPLTKLTAANANAFDAVWSHDGTKLFFDSSRALDGTDAVGTNATSNIWVVNADGSNATPLTKITALGADSRSPHQP